MHAHVGVYDDHSCRRLPKLIHPPLDSPLRYKKFLKQKQDFFLISIDVTRVTPTGM